MNGGDTQSRRGFLASTARLTGSLVVGSAIAAVAPGRVWALELDQLTQNEAESILALARILFPHPSLPDAVYALVVKEMGELADQPVGKALILDGLATLDRASGQSWRNLDETGRLAVIDRSIATPLVQKVRAIGVSRLYDNDMAYAHFGYEGDAFSKGGYLHRGFNDLDWLPDPASSASPPFHN